MTWDKVWDALENVGSRPKGSAAHCPAHVDPHASLSVKRGKDDKVLLKCHAGCTLPDILTALSLEMTDLFPDDLPKRGQDLGPPTDTYDYVDEEGRLLYQVLRFSNPKTFRHRAADGSWSMQGVRRVPYRLPNVLDAVMNGDTLLLVEGEKDVHAVERAGGVATSSGSAGSWRSDFNQYFRGGMLVVVADNDEEGIKHARAVANQLRPVARGVWLALPKDGNDVSDHLAAGHTLDDLVDLVEAPPPPVLAPPAPAPLEEAAFHGPAGAAALELAKTSEASAGAILIHLLVGLGSMIKGPVVHLGDGRYAVRQFALLIGETGDAKGTAYKTAERVLQDVEPYFIPKQFHGGIGSGESLIDKIGVTDAEGVPVDIRFCLFEEEFGAVLKKAMGTKATLSNVLRKAWDGGPLMALARTANKGGSFAADSHISVMGHITPADLSVLMEEVDMLNGLMNRFLFVWATRAQFLDVEKGGAPLEVVEEHTQALRLARIQGAKLGRIWWSPPAAAAYNQFRREQPRHSEPRVVAMEARTTTHLARLAGLYAVLDGTDQIDMEHYRAAMAVVRHSMSVVRFLLLNDGLPDIDRVALPDKVYSVLIQALQKHPEGLTGAQRHKLVTSKRRAQLDQAIETLERRKLARMEERANNARVLVPLPALLGGDDA